MTTLDLQRFVDERARANGPLSRMLRVFAPLKRWSDRKRTLAQLAHLDQHLLRDLGLDPPDFYYPSEEQQAVLRDMLDRRSSPAQIPPDL